MKTSVALCTYNGEKYLQQQLESILQQTKKVDEIIVCDDGSTDNTLNILSSYEKKYPEQIIVYNNSENLRSVKNFEKAINLCTGDIIFLSDQDDIWMQNKVEIFIDYFSQNSNINVICSNGKIIDENNNIIDNVFTIWDIIPHLKTNNIDVDFYNIIAYIENIATGATMAIRKNVKELAFPIPNNCDFHHDEWIALMSSYNNQFLFIDEKLIKYRIHPSQQVGGVIYKNHDKTKKRLLNHFNLFSKSKTFSQYKKLLKRLSINYKKHKDIIAENPQEKLSKELVSRIQNLHKDLQTEAKEKFPIRFMILNTIDNLTGKRQLK